MKFNNLTSLFLSTFLVTTAASAMYVPGELSDALNGFNVPENGRIEHRARIQQKLREKADRKGHIFQQAKRHYTDRAFKGSDYDRQLANSILDVLEKDFDLAKYRQEMYDSYGEDGIPFISPKNTMNDLPPKAGHHIAMVREVEKLSEELKTLNAKIAKRPEEKNLLQQKHNNNTASYEKLERESSELEEKKQTHLKKQAEYKDKFEEIDSNIDGLKGKINQIQLQQEEIRTIKSEVLTPKRENLKEREEALALLEIEENKLNEQLEALTHKKDSPEEKEEASNEIQQSIESNPTLVEENSEKKSQSEELKRQLEAIQLKLASPRSEVEGLKLEIQQLDNGYSEKHNTLELQIKEIQLNIDELTKVQEQSEASLLKEVKEPMDLIEKQMQENAEKAGQLQKELTDTEKVLENFDSLSEKLAASSSQLKIQLREIQDEADLYALIKYFKFLNFYLALPNDDFGHGEDGPLQILSYYDLPVIRRITDHRASEAGRYNVETAVPREIQKYSDCVQNLINRSDCGIKEKVKDKVSSFSYSYQGGSDQFSKELKAGVVETFQADNFNKQYERDKNRNAYDPLPISDDDFTQEIKILDSLRADHLFKISALKWKGKLSSQPDSLIHRLGFVTALFNKDFDFKNIKTFFSFKKLHESLPIDILRAPDKIDWKFASVQLKTNFAQDWIDMESPEHVRITPILAFVNNKALKASKKDHIEKKQEKPIEKSFLKMMSYMNMAYALTHHIKGNAAKPLHLIEPALEPYLKDHISLAQRLDYVMANKALKYADRIWQHGQDFIEEYGLKGWFFDNYPAANLGQDKMISLKSIKTKGKEGKSKDYK